MVWISADATEQHVQSTEIKAVELERTVAGHEWVVFVPKAEGRCKFIGDSIAISNEKPKLPFLGGRLNELIAFTYTDAVSAVGPQFAGKAQLKLRQRIELVGRGATVECRNRSPKVKLSTRTSAQFGLPVIQVMMNYVYACTDLVLAVRPAHVMRARETPIVAVRRVPTFGVT